MPDEIPDSPSPCNPNPLPSVRIWPEFMSTTPTRREPWSSAGTVGQIQTQPNSLTTEYFVQPCPPKSLSESKTSTATLLLKPQPRDADHWSKEVHVLWDDIVTMRWAVVPSSSVKLLMIPLILWSAWEAMVPYVATDSWNPFTPFLFISHLMPDSSQDDPQYRKGWFDLLFVAYYIIFWSCIRQTLILHVFLPVAKHFRVREARVERFGEQGYAMLYFAVMGAWGVRIMGQLPTWWYRTEVYWNSYPQWTIPPELKAYYLMQMAYWLQQILVLVLGLEKPRKDYAELVAHHMVTIWLVAGSYVVNMTYIGNAVFVSMDIPDVFLAASLLLNYIKADRAKVVVFVTLLFVWAYFRHYLNLVMMWSLWTQYGLIPEFARRFSPLDGVWAPGWGKYLMFTSLLLLQCLQIAWFSLMLRIGYRAVTSSTVSDSRESDDEDEDEACDDAAAATKSG
ncbi:hypothetical protein EIP91_003121 [Steccherinum ochraceum]|uniref:TLC domain-containing protein n=1 Tax=Steccherinum ochraceum TaxID=92696 RepID=A0A4R0S2H9_9APHY|nr:hypothetical protein EIP91_003121 [Steccherinum ochraceum]